MKIPILLKGGPGSGNFGHEGRPGERGGSGEGGENIKETGPISKALKELGGKAKLIEEGEGIKTYEVTFDKNTPLSIGREPTSLTAHNPASIAHYTDYIYTVGEYRPEDAKANGTVYRYTDGTKTESSHVLHGRIGENDSEGNRINFQIRTTTLMSFSSRNEAKNYLKDTYKKDAKDLVFEISDKGKSLLQKELSPINKIDLLSGINKALSLEYSAFIQYYQHAAVLEGPLTWFAKDMLAHAEQEAGHAQKLNEHLNYLGIAPSVTVGQVKISPLTIEMLKQDLESENIAILLYSELVEKAMSLRMPATALILSEILEDEQHHANDLETILEAKK